MVLLALDRTPGTIEEVATSLRIPNQIANSSIARLMQFGLVEVQLSPLPLLTTSNNGRDFIRSGRALPERTEDREVGISLVVERVGQSVLRNREVVTVSLSKLPPSELVVSFPMEDDSETDDTMAQRVSHFMAGSLRPGEWLRGVQAISSVIERKFLVLDLNDVKNGVLPEGASDHLIQALQTTINTGVLPQISAPQPSRSPSIRTTFEADQLIVGSEHHLESFERIVGNAKSDVFVLSTFVAAQADERGKEQRERIWKALEEAVARGVRCHLFFGTSLDDGAKNAIAMQELNQRLSGLRRSRGFVLVQRDTVGSHAKFVVADDGHGGAAVLFGSCNWLSSPFSAVEVSAELRENQAAAIGLDILRSIVSKLSSASRSVETLQFMASELRRSRSMLSSAGGTAGRPIAELTVLYADDHERLLRVAAHEADQRFICCTNKVGAPMVPALFNPAEAAGRRIEDVRVYFSRYTGPTKRRHVSQHRERLDGLVNLIGVRDPQLHAKFLTWDKDHVVISSMNWGSQSGLPDNPHDEIGLYVRGPDLATSLLEKFEAKLKDQL
jgi:phosphatidylserine/phosphatidylglycerophosphate/cardiolipin synthase-like enzyme